MNLVEQIFTAATLAVILAKVAPLLLAALGGAFTQQGNILNIGLEGMMLIGAFTAIAVGSTAGSALVGVIAAIIAGLLLALVYAAATLGLKADFIVVGIGVNLLAAGLSVFLLQVVYGNPGVTPGDATIRLPRIDLGPLGEIPVLGQALDRQTAIVWLALLAVPVSSFVLYRTRFGVHLRAVGEDEAAAEAAGISVNRVKFASILISGALCGLAGAQLAMATLGSFTANMTAGRGFIAVAALTFGLARPVRTMVAAFIFGAADAIADLMGIEGINSNLALMTPYIITIIALVLVGIRFRKLRSGRALATPAPRTA
ncbi:ABC transporter permease [Actinotalea ferrariae CF5-4]|uniref:ABC transporter permease n=1 Tax=Actinotalea ferrariae CF5-4 TaxID=948458 RepID=A0A021W144_9CELL|nr:ABC transporter permease [Actinotalea ferrariae]EYR65047.1 ABC transporter permease [Actinotalea ferrariae CF5-4]